MLRPLLVCVGVVMMVVVMMWVWLLVSRHTYGLARMLRLVMVRVCVSVWRVWLGGVGVVFVLVVVSDSTRRFWGGGRLRRKSCDCLLSYRERERE